MLKNAVQQGRSERRADAYPLGYVEGLNDARTKLADFFSILQKTARPCVEHRNCHPSRVTFSNPSVALADCSAPHPSLRLAFTAVPSGTDIESASLEPSPRH